MPAIIEFRVQWPAGRAVFRLTQQEAVRVAVALRRLGLGLTVKPGQAMVTTRTARFSEIESIVRAVRR